MANSLITGPKLGLLVASACLAGWGAPVVCAAAEASAGSNALEEVVVTAQRREESLQSVPISVTAMTSKDLEEKNIVDVLKLSEDVPGMTAKTTFGPEEITVAIRGVTQLIPAVNADPAIGIYVDGVYNAIDAGSNNGMIDMERAEVLKGPQGTLFGRNTIGGAVSITTAKPTDKFSGYVQADAGNYGAETYTGVINGPLDPGVLDGRVVYQHTAHGGYGTNTTYHVKINTLDQDYVRGSLKFMPNDAWDIIGSAFYDSAHGFFPGSNLGYVDTTASLAPGILPPNNIFFPLLSGHPGDLLSNYVGPGGTQNVASGLLSSFSLKTWGITGTATGRLGDAVTLKSITAYTHTLYNSTIDLDGTPYDLIDLLEYPITAHQFSQELQVYGDALDHRLTWIAGAYYFEETGSQISEAQVLQFLNPVNPAGINTNPQGADPAQNTSYANFAQLSYEFAPHWKLTGGARYVSDERQITYRDHSSVGQPPGTYVACSLANAPFDPNPANCVYQNQVSYHYVPWTVDLDFKPTDDTLIYAKIAKGYRSGAYNLTGPQAVGPGPGVTAAQAAIATAFALKSYAPVAPENLISYEIGSKVELLDHHLRLNDAIYWSKYNNVQVTVNLPAACPTCTPIAALENTGGERIYGGELEATALIGSLEAHLSVGYTNPEYTEGPGVGTDVINISKQNYAASLTYPVTTSAGKLTMNADWSYRSRQEFYTISPGTPPAIVDALSQSGYGLVDARVSFELARLPLTIAAYGQNLTNKVYVVSASNFAPPLNYAYNQPGNPRTYGVSLNYKY